MYKLTESKKYCTQSAHAIVNCYKNNILVHEIFPFEQWSPSDNKSTGGEPNQNRIFLIALQFKVKFLFLATFLIRCIEFW